MSKLTQVEALRRLLSRKSGASTHDFRYSDLLWNNWRRAMADLTLELEGTGYYINKTKINKKIWHYRIERDDKPRSGGGASGQPTSAEAPAKSHGRGSNAVPLAKGPTDEPPASTNHGGGLSSNVDADGHQERGGERKALNTMRSVKAKCQSTPSSTAASPTLKKKRYYTKVKVKQTNKDRWGEKNHRWKNGKKTTNQGYVVVRVRWHPNCTAEGYVAEHRLVMEKHLGRLLTDSEVVHHNNGDGADNRIENLVLFATPGLHSKYHAFAKRQEATQLSFNL